jgi:hypothetical protein
MTRSKVFFSGILFLSAILGASPAAWPDCGGGSGGYTQAAVDMAPLTVIRDGRTHSLRLVQAYDLQKHPCLTATVGFLAAGYGMALLFGDETPVIEDLMAFTPSPGGSMGALDYIFKGDNPGDRTWPPAGVKASTENFVFQFLRKSTMQAVTVRLKDGLWPEDWFALREKQHAGTITEAEKKKRDADRTRILERFPAMPYAELFGNPEVYTFIAWGYMEKGEMDRLIREQRRQAGKRR